MMIKYRFNTIIIFISLFVLILSIGLVSASDNVTDEASTEDIPLSGMEIVEDDDESGTNHTVKAGTAIQTKNVNSYYKENTGLVSYLKDAENNPISNKRVSIFIGNAVYNKVTDNHGKIVLKLNLKPNTYRATVKFDGDGNYNSSVSSAIVKIKKSTLTIATTNYKTYFESGFFFKAKVINKITKNLVKNVKVVFKVYLSHNKYKLYYSTTDANGIAKLRKNLKVGVYKVVTQIKKNKYLDAKKSKAILTIKETAETGCTSLYVQVSNHEAVAGFRRDATNAKTLHIVKYKLNGIPAVKQYKTNSYFFHTIVAANGWMAGTGGIDNPQINHAIENLAGKMIKVGKIKKSHLRKIQGYERQLGLGHFSIKAPNGKFAVVWGSKIICGKLKPGEYFKAPNARSMFHHGNYKHFSKNPAKAAIKIAASDSFGINRRDATAFHWKATTHEGKTTAKLKVYAANDNGKLAGRSTGHLKDDVIFKGKFFSKNKLPKTPSKLLLGVHNFKSIDKLIKTQTKVKAPKLTKNLNESKTFNITVKDKKSKKAIKNLKLKLKIDKKTYTVKTNSKGIAKFNTKSLGVGNHDVVIYSANEKYFVSAKSTIKIK